jgi:hypothetical protein
MEQPGLSDSEKLVLCALTSFADRAGFCWPSQRAIAERAGRTDRTVRTILPLLEARGLITREHRHRDDGGRTSDGFCLTPPEAPASAPPGNQDFRPPLEAQASDEVPGRKNQMNYQAPPPTSPTLLNESPLPVHAPRAVSASDGFNEFYRVYPRHVGKGAAMKAWAKAVKIASPEEIIAGACRLANDPNLPEQQYVPHPATWLNRIGWEDEPCPCRKSTVTSVQERRRERNGAVIAQAIQNPPSYGGIHGLLNQAHQMIEAQERGLSA